MVVSNEGSTARETAAISTSLKLWVVLARAYRAVAGRAGEDISRHDLTAAEFGVLEALHHKGPLLLGEIQKKVLISSGGITYVIDRLTGKQLVQRLPSPDDRRACFAALTDEGSALMAKIFPVHEKHLQDVLAGLNEREQREATDLLRKLGRYAAEFDAEMQTVR